jgi:integrase
MDDSFIWDTKITGLGLRERDGHRTWIIQYRIGHQQRRQKIADAEHLTRSQARELAKKKLAEVALGRDPAADKRRERKDAKFTLGVIIADYLKIKRAQVRDRTYEEVERYLEGAYWSALHGTPIAAITRRDVAAALQKMISKHGSTSAARARSALSAFYAWAMGEGLSDSNPVVGTNKPSEGEPRERVLDDRELVAIWNAVSPFNYGRIIKLLILLGARREEIGGLRWDEVDEAKRAIKIAAERAKNHRAHELPLSDLAWSVLAEQPRVVGREHVFGDGGQAGFNGWSRGKTALDKRLGKTVAAWRLHDIRRSVATGMIDLGVEPHHVEAVLNHYGGHRAGVAGIYNRATYAPQIKTALALWSDHVRALVEGGERKVLPLRA